MSENNIIKPDREEQASLRELTNAYNRNMSTYNRLSERSPYDGALDRNGELRLRLALIDNPEIDRSSKSDIDPLDITTVVNMSTGQVALKWVDLPGGSLRPQELSGEWKHVVDNDKANPEERDYDEWNIESRREMVSLTHPFFWSNQKNWCGINYIPPVGSLVVVGFKKHGFPVILGYLPSTFKNIYPVLKPGETIIKGYGNNYIHNRWSDKMDLKAWCNYNEIDIDDPKKNSGNPKKNKSSCTLWIRMNANDRKILIQAAETDPGNKVGGSSSTSVIVTPKGVNIIGDVTISGTLSVGESTTLKSSLSVSGNTSMKSNASISGSLTVDGSLSHSGTCC